MTQQNKDQLKLEIDHIFESGANEIRIFNMVVDFIDKRFQTDNTPKLKDGNECIGMAVMCIKESEGFTKGKWYMCVGNYNRPWAFIDNDYEKEGACPDNDEHFDLSNPRPIQPK